VHGISGHDGIARVGFHLHGAIAFNPQHDTFVADERDSWFSQYLVDRQVIMLLESGEYALGSRPEAALKRAGADTEIKQLGLLLGILFSASENGKRVLDENDLIVLTTCVSPRDTAAAIAAELKLFERWFSRDLRSRLAKPNWSDAPGLESTLNHLLRSYGYLALNSARLKYSAYKAQKPADIVSNCERYLKSLSQGSFLALQWRSYWNPVLAENSEEQISRFDPWIQNAATEVFDAAIGILLLQKALSAAVAKLYPSTTNQRRLKSLSTTIEKFVSEIDTHMTLNSEENDIVAQLQSKTFDPKVILATGLEWTNLRLPALSAMSRQVLDIVKDYGHLEHRINFNQVLWFDIVDSTGQKSGLSNPELRAYRARIRGFKEAINNEFYGLSREASRQNGIVHGWQGTVFAKDDEKHIFFTGTRNLAWLREATRILFARCAASGARVRAIAIPADFAGIAAYRYRNDPTVDSEPFWEHLSRVKKQLRERRRPIQIHLTCGLAGNLFARWN
jgi:hypothetical protein